MTRPALTGHPCRYDCLGTGGRRRRGARILGPADQARQLRLDRITGGSTLHATHDPGCEMRPRPLRIGNDALRVASVREASEQGAVAEGAPKPDRA